MRRLAISLVLLATGPGMALGEDLGLGGALLYDEDFREHGRFSYERFLTLEPPIQRPIGVPSGSAGLVASRCGRGNGWMELVRTIGSPFFEQVLFDLRPWPGGGPEWATDEAGNFQWSGPDSRRLLASTTLCIDRPIRQMPTRHPGPKAIEVQATHRILLDLPSCPHALNFMEDGAIAIRWARPLMEGEACDDFRFGYQPLSEPNEPKAPSTPRCLVFSKVGEWHYGVPFQLSIEILAPDGQIEIWKDGERIYGGRQRSVSALRSMRFGVSGPPGNSLLMNHIQIWDVSP